MLFNKETYVKRREQLRLMVGSGIILLPGNNESPCNYPSNTYHFRQDSSFLYFFGQTRNSLIGVLDADTGEDILVGADIDIDDIIWYGEVESVQQMAEACGANRSATIREFASLIADAVKAGRKIHFLPPYRHDTQIMLLDQLGVAPAQQREEASWKLIDAVVKLRSVKSSDEIAELTRASSIGYALHTAAMRAAGTCAAKTEREIAGLIEGIALSHGAGVSFQSIVSMHGEILHGYPSDSPLEKGRLLLVDAGAETVHNYCSDHTRVTPIGGKFSSRQRDIYNIVADCHDLAKELSRPGVLYLDVHMAVCRLMTERLKELGLMRGNTEEAVAAGAHALFLPHGLGHAMGMDVHDMEGLGQSFVGFDDSVRPSSQFGLASLRFGRALQEGFVLTDEPGIYFIPALIDLWRRDNINADFLCFDEIEKYKDFGGIRIEDDLLVTADGAEYIGDKLIPYRPDDVEQFIANN